jgi:hypothetical protein
LSTATIDRLLQLTAVLLIGMLLGAALMVFRTGQQLEQLQLERGQLLSHLRWYRTRVNKLSEKLSTHQWVVVEEVELVLQGVEESSPQQLYLREELLPFLKELLGRRVTELEPELVTAMFEGRSLEYEKTRFSLHVHTLVIARRTRLVLEVWPEPLNLRDQSE